MGTLLNWGAYSGDFRFKILKPMFVNFLMATNVFDMPAALFARYLEFFDIESATPMQTWDQGTRRIYENLSADFQDKIYLSRPVRKVYRQESGVVVEDENGEREAFDEVIFATNANQTLMMLEKPTFIERYILSSIRYESELHNHTVVHSDSSVLPDNEVKPLTTRSNHIEQYGARPDNYEITYIMHNQQPWANRSDRPCLVTYNPISPIDERKVIRSGGFSTSSTTCVTLPGSSACSASFRASGARGTAVRIRSSTARRRALSPGSPRQGSSARTTPSTIRRPSGCSTTTAESCTAGALRRRNDARGGGIRQKPRVRNRYWSGQPRNRS